ncbi:hypothetical protein L6452_13459 [Arctium lappa]|uniref:Uncharacterized protein n=1 Tax=Arctium lappa TaxID=4217 RepID=A0ACB9CIC7_ARCLA|nr:hypothetical protein L6452_13459 [Arctium lappa]
MQRELDELRRRANIARETSEELRKSNSQVFAERDKLKDKVLSLEVEINKLKEKATQDRDNTIAQDEMLKIEKERKDFAKKFSDFSRKAFEEKKSLELRCVKLSQQVSDFEKVIIIEREKAENEKKKAELKDINTEFSEEKKIFETGINKLTRKLSELSTNIMKEKNAKSELHKKDDEKDKGNWIWRVKGSPEEKKKDKSFLHTSNAKWNNAPKGTTFGKPDLVYTINQLIRQVSRQHMFIAESKTKLLNKEKSTNDLMRISVKQRQLYIYAKEHKEKLQR